MVQMPHYQLIIETEEGEEKEEHDLSKEELEKIAMVIAQHYSHEITKIKEDVSKTRPI